MDKIEAARNLLRHDPAGADALLASLREETQTAISGIRRLVYGLRPPALDELGLVHALREHAARFVIHESGDTGDVAAMRVSVDASEDLDALPAAVEVAAYRIALEAVTNASRHSRARLCTVRLRVNGALELEVVDDGNGLSRGYQPGVGLQSMRERAAELGGSFAVESADGGGTRVRARLPLIRR